MKSRVIYPIYMKQNYPDRDLDSNLDQEILYRVNTDNLNPDIR